LTAAVVEEIIVVREKDNLELRRVSIVCAKGKSLTFLLVRQH
jgi:hypothetical protein